MENPRDTEIVEISLVLTRREAEMLTVAANELYHHMQATAGDPNLGGLIINENILAARSLWRKIEDITRIIQ